jgi:hypothetical protein
MEDTLCLIVLSLESELRTRICRICFLTLTFATQLKSSDIKIRYRRLIKMLYMVLCCRRSVPELYKKYGEGEQTGWNMETTLGVDSDSSCDYSQCCDCDNRSLLASVSPQ